MNFINHFFLVFAFNLFVCFSFTYANNSNCSDLFENKDVSKLIIPLDNARVAAVQYPLEEGVSSEYFLNKVEAYVSQAKEDNANLVVFPELITTEVINWNENDIPQLQAIADNLTPVYFDFLISLSKKYQISILGGTTPRRLGQKIVNTAPLALPSGELILQDKIFLTPDEKAWGWSPGEKLKVHKTEFGRVAILICFDCEFPVLSQGLVPLKPDLILVPSWTGTLSGLNRVDWSSRARAIEHYAFVIKTGTVPGVNSTQPHFSRSTILTPQEPVFPTEIVEGNLNDPGIIFSDLDLKAQRDNKPISGVNPSREQELRVAPIIIE